MVKAMAKAKVEITIECLNQKAPGRGENGDFENRSAAYIRVREHRKRGNCDLQPGMATFGSDTETRFLILGFVGIAR